MISPQVSCLSISVWQPGAGPGRREHVAPAHPQPHPRQFLDGVRVHPARSDVRGVERTHRGADQQIRDDAPLAQSSQHPDLDGAQVAAA
jgi:hypothetical protein